MRLARAFNALAMALQKPATTPDVRDAEMELYAKALEDLPIEAIEDAAIHVARTAKWFPKTSEWHKVAAESVSVRFRKALGHVREEPWHEEHPRAGGGCGDTGWRQRTCTADERCGRDFCKRLGEDYTHSYVTVCDCRAWNGTWQRNHQVITKEPQAAR